MIWGPGDMPEVIDPALSPDMAVEILTGYRETVRRRDELVRMAYRAGLTRQQIHIHSGLARTTINKALAAR